MASNQPSQSKPVELRYEPVPDVEKFDVWDALRMVSNRVRVLEDLMQAVERRLLESGKSIR